MTGVLAPWRRAPLLLLRRPGVALVLAGAGLVLSMAAASGPLFVSSAADATLASELATSCTPTALAVGGRDLFAGYASGPDPLASQMFELNGTTRAAAVPPTPHVGTPVRAVTSEHVHATLPGAGSDAPGAWVTIVAKPDAIAHVDVVSKTGEDGAWLADTAASALGVRPGDTVELGSADARGKPVAVRVAGIFKDLQHQPDTPYWCDVQTLIHPPPGPNPPPVFAFALLDVPTMKRVAASAQLNLVDATTWPVQTGGLTVPAAEHIMRVSDGLATSEPAKLATARDAARRAYQQAHPGYQVDGTIENQTFERASAGIDRAVQRAGFVGQVLPSTVNPITLAGAAVTLLLVAAAGSFWVDRRRREVDVLLAHGSAPASLGVKAALESLIPFAVGIAGGWFAAQAMVRALGPASTLSAASGRQAILASALAGLAGIACIGSIAAIRCAGRERGSALHERPAWARLPWDVVLPALGAVLVLAVAKGSTSSTDQSAGAVAHVDPAVLVVPLLAFLAAVALVARLLGFALRRWWHRGARLGVVRWLAWRRLSAVPLSAALVVAAVALPTAISIYGATVNASVHRTLHDEAELVAGADLVVDLAKRTDVPAALRDRATLVLRRNHPTLGDTKVSVIGVDPATFVDDAFWDAALPAPSLASLISRLHDRGPGQPLLGVLSGGGVASGSVLDIVAGSQDVRVPVDLVGQRVHLPGEQGGYQVLFVDRTSLERLSRSGTYEFWIKGDPRTAKAALADAGITPVYTREAQDVIGHSYVQPVAYTFTFLNALVMLTSAVGLGGLMLYLDARSRSRRVAYVLTRRMRLRRRQHLASFVVELGAVMAVGCIVGLAAAASATGALAPRFAVDPNAPPSTVLTWPLNVIALDLAVVAGVVLLAATAAHFASERVRPAEVLRVG